AGGFEFHWWCTEAPDAFVGDRPVHKEMREELVALVGPKVFRRLQRYLEARAAVAAASEGEDLADTAGTPVALPHPALRRR
ncbi:MAG: hypothetical protein KGJ77_08845, partial [Acidobacteriota bacterium]|nr:hypothetical protein [Acidobacteriota bacterium]